MRLESGYSEVVQQEERAQGRKTIRRRPRVPGRYMAKHRAATFAEYALGHVKRLLGDQLVLEVTPGMVKKYQTDRLTEKAAPKTVNEEVALLLRLCGDQGDLIRDEDAAREEPEAEGRAIARERRSRWRSRSACWPWLSSPRRRRALPATARRAARSRRRATSRAARLRSTPRWCSR